MNFAFLTAAAMACAFSAPATAQFSLKHPSPNRVAPTGTSSGSFSAINSYTIDDGTDENSLGLTAGGTICAIQKFTTVGPSDVITQVSACFGSLAFPGGNVTPGAAVSVFVWQDGISQDGNPADATLVCTASGTVNALNIDNDVFQTFTVPPGVVSGVFFVGCSVVHTANQFPSTMDQTTSVVGTAWVTGNGIGIPYTGTPTPSGTLGIADMTTVPGGACKWLLRAEGGFPFVTYCTAKTNSLNGLPACPNGIPVITSTGVSSATATSGFTISATNCRNNKIGILLYKNSVGGNAQGAQFPFTGGFLCFATGFNPNRTTAVNSGGTPAPVDDCSGVFSIDMNAFAHGVFPPPPLPQGYLLTNGQQVCAQFWGRDPGFAPPNNTQLSDAIMWNIAP